VEVTPAPHPPFAVRDR